MADEGITESYEEPCQLVSSRLGCPLHKVQHLCVTMKPPPFPPWLNESEVATLKMDCSSYQVYEELCLQGRGAFVGIAPSSLAPGATNISTAITGDVTPNSSVSHSTEWSNHSTAAVDFLSHSLNESPAIAYQWIGPGFVLSLAAIMLASTVAFYIWHTTHKKKIAMVPQEYVDYNYLHHKATRKINWNDAGSECVNGVDNMQKIVPVELCVRALVKQGTIHDEDLHIMPAFGETDSFQDEPVCLKNRVIPSEDVLEVTVTSQDSANRSDDKTQALHTVVPFAASQSAVTMKWGRTCGDTVTNTDTVSVQGLSRNVESGYVNAAYDGTDSVKEGRSPKKKGFFSWLF